MRGPLLSLWLLFNVNSSHSVVLASVFVCLLFWRFSIFMQTFYRRFPVRSSKHGYIIARLFGWTHFNEGTHFCLNLCQFFNHRRFEQSIRSSTQCCTDLNLLQTTKLLPFLFPKLWRSSDSPRSLNCSEHLSPFPELTPFFVPNWQGTRPLWWRVSCPQLCEKNNSWCVLSQLMAFRINPYILLHQHWTWKLWTNIPVFLYFGFFVCFRRNFLLKLCSVNLTI